MTALGRQPNGIKFSSLIKSCCSSLESRPEAESDLILVHLVRLQGVVDDSIAAFGIYDPYEPIMIRPSAIEMNVKARETQLAELKKQWPPHISNKREYADSFFH
jgi:hypothetical protein